VPVAKSWPPRPSIRQKECIKCCDMYSIETYIIILWWQLRYMNVICVIWYKIFTVFQNYWGGRGGARPLVSATAIRLRRAFSVFAERNCFSYLYPNFYSEKNFDSKLWSLCAIYVFTILECTFLTFTPYAPALK
jgi:hypothetical protein